MGNCDITDEQIEAFERDGAVTIDTPLTSRQIADASELMDRMLPVAEPNAGEKVRYRVGKNNVHESAFVRIIEQPFFEQVAKRLLQSDEVVVVGSAIRKTHPDPANVFKDTGEHTDLTFSLADMASIPRRMELTFFIWIADVDEKCAPLVYRPGSHRQIAEYMGDKPRYIHGPFDKDDYVNMPDAHAAPVVIGTFSEHWPDLEYADSIPIVASAGQMTAINLGTIHAGSTNVGARSRKRLSVSFWPRGTVIGENKGRSKGRKVFQSQLVKRLSPGRRHLVPDDVGI